MPFDINDARHGYQGLVKARAPKAAVGAHLCAAFLVGGLLCLIGQAFLEIYEKMGFAGDKATAPALATMIFLGAAATALGVYDRLGEWAGAGAAIPITGFANSIVSSAIEYKREGFLLGMAAKMFVIAGPVLVYGIIAGFLVGLIKVFLLPLIGLP